jgi:hypothetical protein
MPQSIRTRVRPDSISQALPLLPLPSEQNRTAQPTGVADR